MSARGSWRSGPGAIGGALVVVTLVGLLGVGFAWARPQAPQSSPPKQKPHCFPESPGPVEGSQLDPREPLCGSAKDDRLSSKFGASVEAFSGNDTICARNGSEDDIWGGSETKEGDRAYIDRSDLGGMSLAVWKRKRDIEIVTTKSTAWTRKLCPRRTGYAAAPLRTLRKAAEPLRGPAYGPIIFCDLGAGAAPHYRMWFPLEPTIRAANQGRGIQWQTVAWSAFLFKQQGAEWVEDGQTIWLWDRTFEEGAKKAFKGHFWRRFKRPQERWFVWFEPKEPGTYRIEIAYHWYKEAPRAQTYGFQVGDDDHVGPNETDGNHDSCTFPKVEQPPPPPPPPPPAPAAAPTAKASTSDPFAAELAGRRHSLPAPKRKS